MIRRLVRNNGRVLVLRLSSPENRNALSLSMIRQLQANLDGCRVVGSRDVDDDAMTTGSASSSSSSSSSSSYSVIRVVVLEHDGPAFSSGHDLRELLAGIEDDSDNNNNNTPPTTAATEGLFRECSNMMRSIVECPIPVIAKVDGVATAAGCQLVASCDLAYATVRSKFATPGVNLGLFCSTPGVALGRSLQSRKHAMEMLLLGDAVSADRAYQMGLINAVVQDPNELDAMVDEVADRIATKSPTAVRWGKPAFVEQMELPSLEHAYELANRTMCDNARTDDCQRGIRAFLAKEPIEW